MITPGGIEEVVDVRGGVTWGFRFEVANRVPHLIKPHSEAEALKRAMDLGPEIYSRICSFVTIPAQS